MSSSSSSSSNSSSAKVIRIESAYFIIRLLQDFVTKQEAKNAFEVRAVGHCWLVCDAEVVYWSRVGCVRCGRSETGAGPISAFHYHHY
jgi:hypothetical protein